MEPARHPFPPVVRWVVAPGLLAGAGICTGLLLSGLQRARWALSEELYLGGCFSLSAALGLSLSPRPVPTCVLSALLGVLFVTAVSFSLHPAVRPPPSALWSFAPEGLMVAVLGALSLAVPHGLWVGGVLRDTRSALILYAVAGFGWTVLASALVPERHPLFELLGIPLGAAQFLALATARRVAGRLDRRPAPTA